MLDGLSAVVYERTAERLQRLREHEAAWREIAWSDGSLISHLAARDLPTTSSGGVLAFLKQSDGGDSGDTEYGDRLFLLRVPSRLRGIPGESWELNGLGEMSNVCIDSAQDLLLFQRCVLTPACVRTCHYNLSRRSNNFHVRTLSSGKVHPSVLHDGSFDLGIASSDLLTEIPVICSHHVAAIVHEHSLSHAALTVKGTVVVWNWKTGHQVAIIVRFSPFGSFPIVMPIFSDRCLRVSDATSPSLMRHIFSYQLPQSTPRSSPGKITRSCSSCTTLIRLSTSS